MGATGAAVTSAVRADDGPVFVRPAVAQVRELAAALAASLAAGWNADADRQLAQLTGLHEGALYAEVGRLARDLHAAITRFTADDRIAALARCDLPDAKARLDYVNARTEEAAHRTLTAIETVQPVVRGLGERAAALSCELARLHRRELGPGEFRELVAALGTFLDAAAADAARVGEQLNDALLAQEFQDLTGQVLRQVTDLVHEMEGHLIGVLQVHGAPATPSTRGAGATGAEGPALVAMDAARVNGQDEVDDLLSDLGF